MLYKDPIEVKIQFIGFVEKNNSFIITVKIIITFDIYQLMDIHKSEVLL